VPLELREARCAHDEVELQVRVFEFPQRRIPGLHAAEGGLEETRPFLGREGRRGLQALRHGKPGGGVKQGGGDPGVRIGGRPHQADLLRGPGSRCDPRPVEDRPGDRPEIVPRQAVECRGLRVADERGRDAPRRAVELPAVLPGLLERVGREAPEHELEVPRVERHAELGLRGEAQHVAGVLLGPALQHGAVGGDGGKLPVRIEDPGQQALVEPVVEGILGLDGPREGLGEACLPDLPGNDKVVLQQDVPLGFLGVGAQPELLDLLDEQARDPQDVDVEHGVLGNRAVPHVEDDGLVGAAGLVHFPAGGGPQLVDGGRASADAGIGRREGLGREVLGVRACGPDVPDRLDIEVEAGKDDLHGLRPLLWRAEFYNRISRTGQTAFLRPPAPPGRPPAGLRGLTQFRGSVLDKMC